MRSWPKDDFSTAEKLTRRTNRTSIFCPAPGALVSIRLHAICSSLVRSGAKVIQFFWAGQKNPANWRRIARTNVQNVTLLQNPLTGLHNFRGMDTESVENWYQ